MKVVINKCYGGYGLSHAAAGAIAKRKGMTIKNDYDLPDMPRHDPDLVAVVEEMGRLASGTCSHLKVVEIPDGIDYVIEEYDGMEWIAENHRTWG